MSDTAIEVEATVTVGDIFPAERPHHEFGMSKLGYYASCPGWRSRPGTSEAAIAGTRLHDIMDGVVDVLKGDLTLNATEALEEVMETGKLEADEGEMNLLMLCASVVEEHRVPEVDNWKNEILVEILRPDGEELNHGYLDLLLIDGAHGTLIDWKFGWQKVTNARDNLQGKGYALAAFQAFPELETIEVIFFQPKLWEKVSRATFHAYNAGEMFAEIDKVIFDAQESKRLSPGPQCDYCYKNGTCTALIGNVAAAVVQIEQIPIPATFDSAQIETPEDAARALYFIDRFKHLLDSSDLRQRCLDLALLNDGKLEAEIRPGETVIVDVKYRKKARTIGEPVLVAAALDPILTSEEVLACCDLSLGKIEEAYARKRVGAAKDEVEKIRERIKLQLSEENVGPTSKRGKEIAKSYADQIADAKLTLTEAKDELSLHLQTEELLHQPTDQSPYLKTRVEKHTNQLEEHKE